MEARKKAEKEMQTRGQNRKGIKLSNISFKITKSYYKIVYTS